MALKPVPNPNILCGLNFTDKNNSIRSTKVERKQFEWRPFERREKIIVLNTKKIYQPERGEIWRISCMKWSYSSSDGVLKAK